MNENAPTNKPEEGEDMSYIEMAQGTTPSTMEAVREAQASGDPVQVAQAEAAADAKYMVSPDKHAESVEALKSRVEKSIQDLLMYLRNPDNKTDEGTIERLTGEVADDLGSLYTFQAKNGDQNATIAGQVASFDQLNDPMLQPLKTALLSYKNTDYGAPLGAVKVLVEEHEALVNRTKASRMGI